MEAPPRLSGRGAVLTVVVLLLSVSPGCDGTGAATRSDAMQQRDADRPAPTDAAAQDRAPTGPRPCPSRRGRAWTIEDRTTLEAPHASVGDVVVGPRGTVTVAWTSGSRSSRGWQVHTSDLPSSAGDPQVLPGPPPDVLPAGAEVSALYPLEDHLAVDGSGAMTAAFHQDLRLASGQTTEQYDLVLSERPAGGLWTPTPHVADDGSIGSTDLAVSPSGAAVVGWDRYDDGTTSSYLSYRPSAGAAWSPARRVAPRSGPLWDVGIDERGRVALLYSTGQERFFVVRGAPGTGWGRPHPLPGRGRALAVGAGGSVVVEGTRGAQGLRPYTVRMAPSGSWGAPVQQPGKGLYPDRPVAIDGAGRALYVYWHGERLMTRRSTPNGRWREPCVLAEGVADPRYFDEVGSHVAVNQRGDALVLWRTKDAAPHLWARYRPAGQAWTEPLDVTGDATRLIGEFRAAVGARGQVGIAWVSGNGRQLHVVRTARPR